MIEFEFLRTLAHWSDEIHRKGYCSGQYYETVPNLTLHQTYANAHHTFFPQLSNWQENTILFTVSMRKENSITLWIRDQGHKTFLVDDLSVSN